VFAENLRDLLLAAPGRQAGRDGAGPGHPHRREGGRGERHRQGAGHGHRLPARAARDWEGSVHTLGRLCATHGVNLIAIGNGTASRETDKLAPTSSSASSNWRPARTSRRWW
jgi:uncharacterized protein